MFFVRYHRLRRRGGEGGATVSLLAGDDGLRSYGDRIAARKQTPGRTTTTGGKRTKWWTHDLRAHKTQEPCRPLPERIVLDKARYPRTNEGDGPRANSMCMHRHGNIEREQCTLTLIHPGDSTHTHSRGRTWIQERNYLVTQLVLLLRLGLVVRHTGDLFPPLHVRQSLQNAPTKKKEEIVVFSQNTSSRARV